MPASRTHELLMHLAGWLAGCSVCVTVVGEGRGSSIDRCRAGVESLTSCVYRIDCRDLTLASELSVSENKTLQCARQAFFKYTSSESNLFSKRYKNKCFDPSQESSADKCCSSGSSVTTGFKILF